jgi:RNA polymerase subunit RPABC4/transcription elongation factor Spt4
MRHDLTSRPEMDKFMTKMDSPPKILCWNCRKLTSFEVDRCEHCGSAFAGSTGGAYGTGRTSNSRTSSRSTGRATSGSKPPPASRKRSLAEIYEDLAHVRDLSASTRGRPREKDVSMRLYQCPACGRFVSEQSTECVCGVRFAPMSAVTFACPECASRIPSEADACPVCGVGFAPSSPGGGYVYACPRCGVHVAGDAVRCSCGAWFED